MRTGVALADGDADDQAGQRRGDLVRVGRVGLGGLAHGRGQRAVGDDDLAGLAVELEEDGAVAVGVRLADGQQLDDQRLARLDLDRDLGAGLRAEEEHRRRQDRGVGDTTAGGRPGRGRPADRAGSSGRRASVASRPSSVAGLLAGGVEVGRGQVLAGPVGQRRAALEHALLQALAGSRPAAGRAGPSKNSTTLSGKASSRVGSSTSSGVRLLATRNRAMSPTTFDDGVTFTMSPKSRLTSAYAWQTSCQRLVQAEGLGLLEQVRVLAAGHLVGVDLGRGGLAGPSRTGRRARGRPPSTGSSRSGPRGRARSRAG